MMLILSLTVACIALKNKSFRCFFVCAAAAAYSLLHGIRQTPYILDTELSRILAFLDIPVLLTLLAATVVAYGREIRVEKQYILPILFCTVCTLVKIARRIVFSVYPAYLQRAADDVMEVVARFEVFFSILDVAFALPFLAMLISAFCLMKRRKSASTP